MSKVTSPDSINRIKHTEVIAASPNSEESIRSLSVLKEKASEILEKENAQFFDILPILESLKKDDIIEILNDLLERKDITSNYQLLSEDHVYLSRQHNFHLLMRLIGRSPSTTLYANEFDILVINPMNTPVSIPYTSAKFAKISLKGHRH